MCQRILVYLLQLLLILVKIINEAMVDNVELEIVRNFQFNFLQRNEQNLII